jgi:hypothetical protein
MRAKFSSNIFVILRLRRSRPLDRPESHRLPSRRVSGAAIQRAERFENFVNRNRRLQTFGYAQ